MVSRLRKLSIAARKSIVEGNISRAQVDPRYLRSFQSSLKTRNWPHASDIDLVLFVDGKSKAWILDAICREILAYCDGLDASIHYDMGSLPRARHYFFSHYSSLASAFRKYPHLWNSRVYTWFTHPRETGQGEDELRFLLKRIQGVICPSEPSRQAVLNLGVPRWRVFKVIGGADPDLFLPRAATADKIGFCSAFYPRKRPELLIEIVRQMPDQEFILLGRHWEESEYFAAMRKLDNLQYVECPYENYPDFYRQMRVFVSPSTLEGGPIPLLEAMMANVTPVASRTGFAEELIRDGINGYLCATDATASDYVRRIRQARDNLHDVRGSVLKYDWRQFSMEIQRVIFDRGASWPGFFLPPVLGA